MCQKFITYCSFGFVRSVSLRKPYHYENGPLRVVALRTCWKSETFLLELIRKWKRPFRKEISTLLLGNNVTYVSTGKEWFELYGWEGFSCFAIQNSSSSTTACDCFSGHVRNGTYPCFCFRYVLRTLLVERSTEWDPLRLFVAVGVVAASRSKESFDSKYGFSAD